MTSKIDYWAGIEPEPLPELLPSVEPFDSFLLPSSFKDWVDDIAERMQVPVDFPAVASMVALASVVGTQVRIRPKQNDPWEINPNLFGCIVAPPSSMKSPVLNAVMSPLSRMEVALRKEYEAETKLYKASQRVRTQELKVIDKKIKDLISAGNIEDAQKEALRLEEEDTSEPIRKRLIVNDTTVQKLGELLNQNPNGLLVLRDELASFLSSLDKDGQEESRGFYLEAWNGTQSFTIDRIGRGTFHIENTCVSIFGGIQPSRIADYVRKANKNGSGDDGFIQRFQLMTYPDINPNWKYIDRGQNQEAVNKAFDTFKRLSNIDINELGATRDSKDDIPYLRFNKEAQKLFINWITSLEQRLRSNEDDSLMQSHLSKYRSLVPSLALLIHLAEGEIGGVSYSALERACGWAEYLESHARRIYTPALSEELDGAYILLKYIRQGKLKDPFTIRDVYRKGWAGLRNRDSIQQAIELLDEYHYVMIDDYRPTVGRPSKDIYINPKTLK